ncbi:hypothetical protein [Reyranella sp.]|uniref:hypothetical protein n=1 Tax=Reyranella sp. TaxID=1929291 RepID=UPI00272F5C4C|nr:hypothetical protein [Reyranella sp.]MDP2376424.1 hypothetical protein [Reyranella sp.]
MLKIITSAALGGVIDLCLRRQEKERLTDWMTDWWFRFESIKWNNFGRSETLQAIAILDRYAGDRLLSKKRWQFVLVVGLIAYLLAVFWTGARAFWVEAVESASVSPAQFLQMSTFQAGLHAIWREHAQLLALHMWPAFVAGFLALAFSISFTRVIAAVVWQYSLSVPKTIVAFVALLLSHVFLVPYVMGTFVAGAMLIAQGKLNDSDSSRMVDWLTNRQAVYSTAALPIAAVRNYDFAMSYYSKRGPDEKVDKTRRLTADLDVVVVWSFKSFLDFFVNGLRVLFALLFLGSFVFRPIIQAPISRLWAGIIESGKPLFALLFGTIGALVSIIPKS